MKPTSKTFRIGELAQQLGASVETIRYYEQEGLLAKPNRSVGNYRLYSGGERERLEFILNCRALDMTLQEIRNLLSLRDSPERACTEVNEALDEHIGHVADRIRVLRGLQAQLKALRARCIQPGMSRDCQILQELSDSPKRRRPVARGIVSAHHQSR